MARITLDGDNDPLRNYPGGSSSFDEHALAQPVAPPPMPAAPARPEGGRDDNGAYVPNPVLPGAPNTYWDGDQQFPIPHGSNSGPTSNPSSNTNSGNDDALAKAIQEQYQKIFGRGPQGNELSTDLDAARRYGLTNPNGPTGGVLGQIAARGNNNPGSGATGNPFQGWSNPNDPRTATSRPNPSPGMMTGPVGTPSGGASYSAPGVNLPATQFSDPYTKLLEDIAHNQLNLLQGNNPQTQQLMDFINKQFTALSNSNGYTPDEFALLRTQAMEPITAGRDAAQQRELERTSRAGYLPTSGLTLDQQRQIDTDYGKMTTAASRDLAINGINRQDQQRNQAIQLGQVGMQIPQQQGTQALDVAGMLYQLPRQAMMDANTIVNGSAPQNVLSPYIQLMQQQQNSQLIAQQQQQQFWENIGSTLAKLFGG